jgi:nucleoredoxin
MDAPKLEETVETMTEASKKHESTEPQPAGPPNAKITKDDTSEKEKPVEHEEKKDSPEDTAGEVAPEADKPLNASELSERFPSLPLQSGAPLLGLYFAASWCPDCTAFTPAIDVFAFANKKDLQIVYISSDTSEAEMKEYVPSSFSVVPFDCEEERADLKRHFGACAAKERGPLGMKPEERKFGIPTLIILEKATGIVATSGGIDDIMGSNGESVVGKWRSMLER